MRTFVSAAVGLAGLFATVSAQAQAIRADGLNFKDPQGRTLILRGVNLGGSSKLPYNLATDAQAVTFVGRPFPLAQADEHFRRLKSWGLTVERLIVPWEAIEHAGPGQYDQAYLDYLQALVARARDFGIKVYIDPHQDGWSREFGGDGAPYWAAKTIGLGPDPMSEVRVPQPGYKIPGYWPPTAGQHGAATMATLFWAGDTFAPGLKVDGVPVQEYLQSHFIKAVEQVALKLRGLDNVIGYDLWNEPASGYVGAKDLNSPEVVEIVLGKLAAPGAKIPTRWDTIQAASGFDPGAGSVVKPDPLWVGGAKDIWRRYGVWDVVDGKPVLLKPDYFGSANGKPAEFNPYLKAFQLRYIAAVRKIAPDALFMQELATLAGPDRSEGMTLGVPGVVSEPHFYDAAVLVSKRYTPDVTFDFGGHSYNGREAILDYYAKSIEERSVEGAKLGGIPTLFGEVGLGFDINNKAAYRTGDFSAQEANARLIFDTMDQALASYDIWNYTADNRNDYGDRWRAEDLSIFSLSQRKNPADIDSGGRALHQIIRPYPMATAGTPLSWSFDTQTRVFAYRFKADPAVKADTEIFVPRLQYPNGFTVSVDGGRYRAEPEQSGVSVTASAGDVAVEIKPN